MRIEKNARYKMRKEFPTSVHCPKCSRGYVYPRVHVTKYAYEDLTFKCDKCKNEWEDFKYIKHARVKLIKHIEK